MDKFIFNHFYRLKHDAKRTYILSTDSPLTKQTKNVYANWLSKIHPLFGMVLSFFSEPVEYEIILQKISSFLDTSIPDVKTFLDPLINNAEAVSFSYKGITNTFPPHLIIKHTDLVSSVIHYNAEEFIYKELEFNQPRAYDSPLGLVFMINNTCSTNCIYCYADTRIKYNNLPIEVVEKMVTEAYQLHIPSIQITGGEFFLYKEWRKLLEILTRYHYQLNLISSKTPLKREVIQCIKQHDISIQISLDALDEEILIPMLNVRHGYLEKMKQTIALLEEEGVRFQIATILTNHNHNISLLKDLYNFLSQFNYLHRWEIRTAFKSLYSHKDFDNYKISRNTELRIEKWIKEKQKQSPLNIMWSPVQATKYFSSEKGSISFPGSRCSANYSHMVVLPDGRVTICEQLYWNPRFLLGDIQTQTIREIWNSPRALKLAFPEQADFQKSSPCKTCRIFDACYKVHNKCYTEVLKAYNDENWDYPDPRCAYAPPFINNLILQE